MAWRLCQGGGHACDAPFSHATPHGCRSSQHKARQQQLQAVNERLATKVELTTQQLQRARRLLEKQQTKIADLSRVIVHGAQRPEQRPATAPSANASHGTSTDGTSDAPGSPQDAAALLRARFARLRSADAGGAASPAAAGTTGTTGGDGAGPGSAADVDPVGAGGGIRSGAVPPALVDAIKAGMEPIEAVRAWIHNTDTAAARAHALPGGAGDASASASAAASAQMRSLLAPILSWYLDLRGVLAHASLAGNSQ